MSNHLPAVRAERTLKVLLRVFASISLFAVVFVAAPWSWMNAIHSSMGLGELPREPIVGYLTRSCSALYALLAGLVWVVTLDLRRYHPLLNFFAWGVLVFGIILFAIDYFEQMPISWTYSEGPFLILFSFLLIYLIRRANLSQSESDT